MTTLICTSWMAAALACIWTVSVHADFITQVSATVTRQIGESEGVLKGVVMEIPRPVELPIVHQSNRVKF